jgi:integrase
VLAELPDSQWRLLFGLSRWGGLRIGSEVRPLTWDDVFWDQQRFLVHSSKTRRYAGHETRIVPIFPELAPLFDQRFAEAAVGEMFVLSMLADRSDAALRKTIERAIIRAGLTPWPRLWHNLRACRQTDLTRKPGIGPAAVRYWMGNSKMVAERHYERVVADDWAVAVGPNADCTEKCSADLETA